MGGYGWNGWQRAGIACWVAGGASVLGAVVACGWWPTLAAVLGIGGAITLATGNSLHKLGTGRERRD